MASRVTRATCRSTDPAVLALFLGAPRGFAETHKNVFEPRLGWRYALNEKTILRGSAGIFHNRVTLNDSMLLGGNPPFQPQVGDQQRHRRQPGRRSAVPPCRSA